MQKKVACVVLLAFSINPAWADEKVSCPVIYEKSSTLVDGVKVLTLKSGNESILLKYEGAGYFSEGLAPVKIGEKWGYLKKPICK